MVRICLFICLLLSTWNDAQADSLPPPYDEAQILPFLEQGWYNHAAFFEDYLKRNPVKTVIEVGSWLGTSTRHIAKCLPEDGKIYAVDHWLGSEEHQSGHLCWRPELSKLYEYFLSNVIHEGLTAKIIPVRMDSITASKILSVEADVVYIDASHDTDSVYLDLKAWFPHVKSGGILCGDDWGYPTVEEAVRRFATERGLDIELQSVSLYILRTR
jgi:Methyltransferase domain